jgi:putative phosphoribosyl transferase
VADRIRHAERAIVVGVDGARLAGDLILPTRARGIVVFAHGSGSSRFSPRNRAVADLLNEAGLATLLMDLLTPGEEREDVRTARLRFDIALLGERVVGTVDWLGSQPELASLPAGTFGASTGAAAALLTAAGRPRAVRAVVSRGGRPDLAEGALAETTAPVLLIVGERDERVLELNRAAAQELRTAVVRIVPGATHLFEEPGALEEVAGAAAQWFERYLV